MRQRCFSLVFALLAVAFGSAQSRAALTPGNVGAPVSVSADLIRTVDSTAAASDAAGLTAAAAAVTKAAAGNVPVLAAAVGDAVKGSQPAYIPAVVTAFLAQSKPLMPQEDPDADHVITAASCAAESDSPEAQKVAAEIAAAVKAAPTLAAQIAAAGAAALPGWAPLIAGAAAKAVPDAAPEIAAAVTAVVPAKAAMIAAKVAKATPTQAASIAIAVLQSFAPLQGATAENQEIATCIAGAVPEAADLVTAAIDQANLTGEILGNPIPIINVSSPH